MPERVVVRAHPVCEHARSAHRGNRPRIGSCGCGASARC